MLYQTIDSPSRLFEYHALLAESPCSVLTAVRNVTLIGYERFAKVNRLGAGILSVKKADCNFCKHVNKTLYIKFHKTL